MKLEIREVKACKNKAYGNYLLRGHNTALITVSLKLNRTLADYSATTLHELLHLWTTLIRKKGFKVTNAKEHDFIYGAEAAIIKVMQKYLSKRRK